MHHLFTQDGIDKLAEIFVYLDLLSAIVAMLVLYEQLEINKERRAAELSEWEKLEERFTEIEQRLSRLEETNGQIRQLLLEVEKNLN